MADIPVYEALHQWWKWSGVLILYRNDVQKVGLFSDLVNIVQHQTIIDNCSWVEDTNAAIEAASALKWSGTRWSRRNIFKKYCKSTWNESGRRGVAETRRTTSWRTRRCWIQVLFWKSRMITVDARSRAIDFSQDPSELWVALRHQIGQRIKLVQGRTRASCGMYCCVETFGPTGQ